MLPCHFITMSDATVLCWYYRGRITLLNSKFEVIAPTYTAEEKLVGGKNPAPHPNKSKIKGTGTGNFSVGNFNQSSLLNFLKCTRT